MIMKTKDYEMFIFRDDNREKIDNAHVQRLIESIKARNLLDLRPICVNEKMEVIDGQHRLLAAKALNVDIYYQIEKSLAADDIIRMNISKSWGMGDYLNFYCEHDYVEYKKLRHFMKRYRLNLKVALNITMGLQHVGYFKFKQGEFKFSDEFTGEYIEICWETIDYIKKMNGISPYTDSSRFWKALIKLVRHPAFDVLKWRNNMQKMIDHFTPKARMEDYIIMLSNIYNYRSTSKINLTEY